MSLPDKQLLQHIHDEVNFLLLLTINQTEETTLGDPVKYRAVIRSLEIIGEATKNLSATFKIKHDNIEWRSMAKTRDILIHLYFSVDNDVLWGILSNDIPVLKGFLTSIDLSEL